MCFFVLLVCEIKHKKGTTMTKPISLMTAAALLLQFTAMPVLSKESSARHMNPIAGNAFGLGQEHRASGMKTITVDELDLDIMVPENSPKFEALIAQYEAKEITAEEFVKAMTKSPSLYVGEDTLKDRLREYSPTKGQFLTGIGGVLVAAIVGPQIRRVVKFLKGVFDAWRAPRVDEGANQPAKRDRKSKGPKSSFEKPSVMPMDGGSMGATLLRAPAATPSDQLADLARQQLPQTQVAVDEEDATGGDIAVDPRETILNRVQPQLPENLMQPGAARKVLRLIMQFTQDGDEIEAAFLTIYGKVGKDKAADLFKKERPDVK